MRKIVFRENDQSGYNKEGLFHQWGTLWSEGAMYSVAIIEMPDGTIVTKNPWEIKFVKDGDTK